MANQVAAEILVRSLVDLLAHVRLTAGAGAASRVGEVSRRVPVWTPNEPRGFKLEWIKRSEPELESLREFVASLRTSAPWLTAHQALTDYVSENGVLPAVNVGLTDVAELYLEPFIREHLSLASKSGSTRRGAVAAAERLLRHLHAPSVRIVSTVVLGGFSASRPFRLASGIHIRPITEDELVEIGNQPDTALFSGSAPAGRRDWWICSVETDSPRGTFDGFNAASGAPQRLRRVLRLLKAGAIAVWMAQRRAIGPYGFAGRMTERPPENFQLLRGTYEISDDDIRKLRRLWVESENLLATPHHFLQLALRRLDTGADRSSPEDRLVDFVVGLEALLSHERDSVGYRIRVRGSVVLGQTRDTRRHHLRKLRDAYDLRSRVVHGDPVPVEELRETAEYAEGALRDTWLWFFRHYRDDGSNRRGIDEIDARLVTSIVGPN